MSDPVTNTIRHHGIGNAAFLGDTLFMPDGGPAGRDIRWETTVTEENANSLAPFRPLNTGVEPTGSR